MGLVKTLKKVFKGRKKRDREENQRIRNQGHQRSIRGGIYEPYRAHFPLKTQQTNYDNVDQYYASWDHPANHQQQQQQPQQPPQQQQKFGPKLISAGGQRQNYEHYGLPTPRNNYEQHEFQPNGFQRQPNYEATRIAKFGEANPFAAPASVAGHENYENHQLPSRSSQSFNHGSYSNHYPINNAIQRSGSNASLSAHLNPYNPYTNHVLQRPRRPSSAILPTRSASDVGFMNSRPMRPGSSQADLRIQSPMRRQIASPFDQRVMSPGPGPANPIALQLRGSQANLQQALRMHEDITRQNGTQAAPELDATMKIMQTCLDMLDSISGLVERSTTPLPTQMNFQPAPDQQNFINHLENKQPVKSALKNRPTLQKSSNSAFTQLRNESELEESEDYGNSPSPKPQYRELLNTTERVELEDFNSPGPSEGGTSVDSGFGKAKTPPSKDDIAAQKAREAKIAQNMAKFETMLRSTGQQQQSNHTDKEVGLTSGPLLSSLSQLRLNA